ncbi:phosphate starvation-inducible protein PhoH [Veillonellaceae bacterium M1-70]|nr:phosphate starvation-inducible protein PhoH [Veillonellaceae bacterium M1-70]
MENRINCAEVEELREILGRNDEFLRLLQHLLPACHMVVRGMDILLQGEAAETALAAETLAMLQYLYREHTYITGQHVRYIVSMLRRGAGAQLQALYSDTISISARGRRIKPKTLGQKAYADAVRRHAVTFGIGPAGTGKTYLAVALGAFYLKNHEVERIVLTRPAVEAGEKLGFLPGDLQEKIDPYLRPLYDALTDVFGAEQYRKLASRTIIEVAPLAYMRGRTLEHAFVILDEAQNTTREQMKMFLTRMGNHSRFVINGDTSQIDLPDAGKSGLVEAERVLAQVAGIGMVHFSAADVVRHDVVSRIIRAYETFNENREEERRG